MMEDKKREMDASENTVDVGGESEASDIGQTCETPAVVEEKEKKS